ncbi:MAG: ABC transporter substrate-binding protein [Oxalobacter sp.]|nr:MAG: ABC transporter substrate-binding protein [Oxalobacter sp.]
MKTTLKKLIASCSILLLLTTGYAVAKEAAAAEAPDVLVKRISYEVLELAKADKRIQAGDDRRIRTLVEAWIMPYVDFDRTTALSLGVHWRKATPEQKEQLTHEYRELLIHTYSGAIAQVKDQRLQFRPFHAAPEATDVVVYSQVIQTGGREPIQLNYRLQKQETGWKIYDINVLGAWLIQTYKGTFNTEINQSGIDGLIKTLREKNKTLARRKGNSVAGR